MLGPYLHVLTLVFVIHVPFCEASTLRSLGGVPAGCRKHRQKNRQAFDVLKNFEARQLFKSRSCEIPFRGDKCLEIVLRCVC